MGRKGELNGSAASGALLLPAAIAEAEIKRQRQAAMTQMEAQAHEDRCGNCYFAGHTTQPNMVECQGGPPTPLFLGIVQTPQGPQPNIVLYRPTVPAALKACALWEPTPEPVADQGAHP